MPTLSVTSRGQVTLRKELLEHMGLRQGEKIEAEKLADGRLVLRSARPSGQIDGFIGLLARKTKKVASLAEIREAAESGWTGKR